MFRIPAGRQLESRVAGREEAGRIAAPLAALSTVLLAGIICGCAREANPPGAEISNVAEEAGGEAEKKPEAVTKYKIRDSFASYYESSPAQGRPPDGEIPPGTSVELIERGGSYSLVKWDGKTGWVATDALHAE